MFRRRAAWAGSDRFQVVLAAFTHVRAPAEGSGSASWFVDPVEGPAFRFSVPVNRWPGRCLYLRVIPDFVTSGMTHKFALRAGKSYTHVYTKCLSMRGKERCCKRCSLILMDW